MADRRAYSMTDMTGLSNERAHGATLVLVSAALFASAGVFTKAISADSWAVVFWRGLFAAVFLALILYRLERGSGHIWKFDRIAVVVAVISSLASAAFIAAFKNTSVANVTLIYASSPFVAALMAWLWIGERPGRSSLLAATFALIGVFITIGGVTGILAVGDLLAVVMTVLMSLVVVIYRVFPTTPTLGPMILSSVLLLPPGLAFGDPFSVSRDDLVLLFAFGLVFAMASVSLLAGAKRLRSAETALLSISETPLAPVLAWFVLAEIPATQSLYGGAIIVVAVLWHLWRELR